jgi:hypothetical protein
MARFDQRIEPMTLGNMRQLGVRSLPVSCWLCHHQAVLSADNWRDDISVPSFGPRVPKARGQMLGAVPL